MDLLGMGGDRVAYTLAGLKYSSIETLGHFTGPPQISFSHLDCPSGHDAIQISKVIRQWSTS